LYPFGHPKGDEFPLRALQRLKGKEKGESLFSPKIDFWTGVEYNGVSRFVYRRDIVIIGGT
jgi:hypothetical protein